MSFEADISAFAKAAGESLDNTIRGVTAGLFIAVVKSTPVDTGRAKGNWQVTTDSPASGVIDREDNSPPGSIGPELAMECNTQVGGTGSATYLTNNLPYIMSLEEGHSDQSPPYAMARGNFERVQSIVEAEARRNRV